MSNLHADYPHMRKDVAAFLRTRNYSQIKCTTIYKGIVAHTTPPKALKFMQRLVDKRNQGGTTPLVLCSECGLPHRKGGMTTVFHSDLVCSPCFTKFFCVVGHIRGPDYGLMPTYAHRYDADPDVPVDGIVFPRIANLMQYRTNVLSYKTSKAAAYQERNITKKMVGDLLTMGVMKRKNLGMRVVPYLGVELECETRAECPGDTIVNTIYRALPDFVICKADGSLHNGLEIVTVPATYEYHKAGIWENFFQENDGPAKFLRAWRSDTYGMHVHVSKSAFTPVHAAKFVMFFNEISNRQFISAFAGRPATRYSKSTPKRPRCVKFKSNKYEAINVTEGPTLEVRLFRGNVSRSGVYRNIEFVQAAFEFCKDASLRHITTKEFITWLDTPTNKNKFPFLLDWCVLNEHIKPYKKVNSKGDAK